MYIWGGAGVLELDSIVAGYGKTQVLNRVDLLVRWGERVALLGRNGMGKTTLLRIAMGLLLSWEGSIRLEGRDITKLPPFRRAWLGLGYVPQGRGLFANLTVEQNLYLGTKAARRGRDIPEFVFDYFPILKERRNQLARTLSGGQQQMLAISRALVGNPSLLLLDEPSEGIQPNLVDRIGDELRSIATEQNIGILLVEQNLDLALRLAERCFVMERGQIVHEGPPESLADEAVIQQMLAV
jgi:urea ABC transporter ATP-binding protein UrtE